MKQGAGNQRRLWPGCLPVVLMGSAFISEVGGPTSRPASTTGDGRAAIPTGLGPKMDGAMARGANSQADFGPVRGWGRRGNNRRCLRVAGFSQGGGRRIFGFGRASQMALGPAFQRSEVLGAQLGRGGFWIAARSNQARRAGPRHRHDRATVGAFAVRRWVLVADFEATAARAKEPDVPIIGSRSRAHPRARRVADSDPSPAVRADDPSRFRTIGGHAQRLTASADRPSHGVRTFSSRILDKI